MKQKHSLIILTSALLIFVNICLLFLNSSLSTSIQQAKAVSITLKEAAARHGIKIGAAVHSGGQNDSAYTNIIKSQFSTITAENDMKPNSWWQGENQYNWSPGEELVSFAHQNGIKVRGHTLNWHQQSGWHPADSVSIQQAKDALYKGVFDTVKNYKDKFPGTVYAWDVTNEVLHAGGTNWWYNKLGNDLYATAFNAAHTADPDAQLIMNDYGNNDVNETNPIYNLAISLRNQGIPVSGVGFQSHFLNGAPGYGAMYDNFKKVSDAGMEVHITELDVVGSAANPDTVYSDIIRACINVQKCTSITVWGLSDNKSWCPSFVNQTCTTWYDGNLQPNNVLNLAIQLFDTSTTVLNRGQGNTPITSSSTTTPSLLAPVITTPACNSVLNTSTPVFAGTGEVGATVKIVMTAPLNHVHSTIVDATGNWSYAHPSITQSGIYSYTLTQTNLAGTVSPATASCSFTINTPTTSTSVSATSTTTISSNLSSYNQDCE